MSKSFFEKYQLLIGIVIVLVVFVGVWQFYLKDSSFFSGLFSVVLPPERAPLSPQNILYTYDVWLSITPSPLCVGHNVVGSITSNIPNGYCTIFVNAGTGFQALVDVRLDSKGSYSTSQRIGTVGTATFRAVCCDTQKNCKISNDVSLIVTADSPPCPMGGGNDGSEGGSFSCGNNGLNCNGNCPTNYDCILMDSETAEWCACVSEGGSIPPDWQPGGSNYHPSQQTNCSQICSGKGFASGRQVSSAMQCTGTEVFEANENASILCCCTPFGGGENNCDGAIVPTGTGDAGAWCAAKTGCPTWNGTQKACDNYWNSVTQQMKCGCVATFWCQENYVYTETGNSCVCPPHTTYQWIDSTHFKCVVP